MKRTAALLAALWLLLLLAACGPKETSQIYTVNKYGTVFTVDAEHGTISDGIHTYYCELSGFSGSGYKLRITYPNGAVYWWQTQGNSGFGGWSDDYDPDQYVDGDTLRDVLEERRPAERSSNHGGAAILLFIIGLFNAISPRASWYLSHGWRYKNAEPSDLALAAARGGGILAIIIAVILLFV